MIGGAVRYLLGKEPGKAYILTSDGVELTSRQALIGSFEFQRRARPDVERVVGHISLSFHPDDDPRMSNQLMLDLAREYMHRMEITDTQYLVVRHTDTKHPHLHILYNRVRYDTTLVPDRNERLRNMRICRADLFARQGAGCHGTAARPGATAPPHLRPPAGAAARQHLLDNPR